MFSGTQFGSATGVLAAPVALGTIRPATGVGEQTRLPLASRTTCNALTKFCWLRTVARKVDSLRPQLADTSQLKLRSKASNEPIRPTTPR